MASDDGASSQETGSGRETSQEATPTRQSPAPRENFEILFYKEQAARCLAEKEAAEAKLAAALAKADIASPQATSSTSSAFPANRRSREQEWDALDYVCVADFTGNPHLAPDPRVGLLNPDRPQAFSLYGCKISDALEGQKSSLKYEYQILAPLLYYFWGAQTFAREYLEGEVAKEDGTAEERLTLLRPYLNSLDRIYEWFLARKELLELRSGVDSTMGTDPLFLAFAQEQVYDRVRARADDGDSWLADIKDAYRSKFDAARIKSMAAASAKKGTPAAGAGSPGPSGVARPDKRRFAKGQKGVSKGVPPGATPSA